MRQVLQLNTYPSEEILTLILSDQIPLPSLPKETEDTKATLLERTRRSMSLLPAQPRDTRKSVNKHRKSKQFPTNQFETPRKQLPIPEDLEDMTPPEKLFSQDADYASVFKSRPKIAMSPTASPAPEGRPGVRENGSPASDQSALVGSIEDDESVGHLKSSPLARVAGRTGL